MLRNVIGHEYRRRSRTPDLVEDLADLDRLSIPAGEEAGDAVEVRRQMACLSGADREILFMAYWEDLSHLEIAQILGCSAAAVRVRLFRARRRLNERLMAGKTTGEGGSR